MSSEYLMEKETIQQAADNMARRALEDVRMKAKREWTELLRNNMEATVKYTKEFITKPASQQPDWVKKIKDHESYIAGLEYMVNYMSSIIENPLNWRT